MRRGSARHPRPASGQRGGGSPCRQRRGSLRPPRLAVDRDPLRRGERASERIAVDATLQLDRLGVAGRLRPLPARECAMRIAGRFFDATVVGWTIPATGDVGEIWRTEGSANVTGLSDTRTDSLGRLGPFAGGRYRVRGLGARRPTRTIPRGLHLRRAEGSDRRSRSCRDRLSPRSSPRVRRPAQAGVAAA